VLTVSAGMNENEPKNAEDFFMKVSYFAVYYLHVLQVEKQLSCCSNSPSSVNLWCAVIL